MLKKKILTLVLAGIAIGSGHEVLGDEIRDEGYSQVMKTYNKIGVVTANGGLNVRKSPGVESDNLLFAIENGTRVTIVGENNGWFNIKVRNTEGWVSSKYISVEGDTGSTEEGKKLYTTASSLNFRSEPSTSSSIQKTLSKGTEVELISKSNEWMKVKHNGTIGYVYSSYVSEKKPEISGGGSSGGGGTTPSKTYLYITASILNFRTEPSTNSSVHRTLSKGTEVEFISNHDQWIKVRHGGTEGYVHSDYVTEKKPGGGGGDSSGSNEVVKSIYVTSRSLNFRSSPSIDATVYETLSKGAEIGFISKQDQWVKVKYNGKVGYVHGDYVSDEKPSIEEGGDSSSGNMSESEKRNKIVELTYAQLGKKYVWGATGPEEFDCSGLTQYVYKKALGINIPRVADDQSRVGTTVSKSELKPGDLIFSDTDGSGIASHVGIYVGDGYMIHAPKPGDVVKKTYIKDNSYWDSVYLWSKSIV